MASYPIGSILLVDNVPDPSGKNHKSRNMVLVVQATEDDSMFVGVAITSQISRPLGDGMVPMPYSKNPACKCKTGLTKESIAVCDWLYTFPADAIIKMAGFTPPMELKAILNWLTARD